MSHPNFSPEPLSLSRLLSRTVGPTRRQQWTIWSLASWRVWTSRYSSVYEELPKSCSSWLWCPFQFHLSRSLDKWSPLHLCGNSAESSLVLYLWKFHWMFRCFLLGLLDSAINSSRIDIQIAQQLYSISWDSIKVEILNRSQLQPCKNSRELPCFYIPN